MACGTGTGVGVCGAPYIGAGELEFDMTVVITDLLLLNTYYHNQLIYYVTNWKIVQMSDYFKNCYFSKLKQAKLAFEDRFQTLTA